MSSRGCLKLLLAAVVRSEQSPASGGCLLSCSNYHGSQGKKGSASSNTEYFSRDSGVAICARYHPGKIYCFADLRARQRQSSQDDKVTPILLTSWSLLSNTSFYLCVIYGRSSFLILRLIPFLLGISFIKAIYQQDLQ